MSASQDRVKHAVEVCDLVKELRKVRIVIAEIRDHVFDTINVPFPAVRRTHDHLIDAEKSIEAAAATLTRSTRNGN